jgi:hypothetical protein
VRSCNLSDVTRPGRLAPTGPCNTAPVQAGFFSKAGLRVDM